MENLGNTFSQTLQTGEKPFEPVYLNLEYIFQKIFNFFGNFSVLSKDGGGLGSALISLSLFVKVIIFLIFVIILFIIFYSLIRMLEVRKKEKEHMANEIKQYELFQKEKREKSLDVNLNENLNAKWQNVLNHVFSENEANWKLAIIEADTLLDELMDQLGFRGENLGEKLKSADRSKFKQLSSAWEAHIVRNKIAHEGADFVLSQREAKRIIVLYEQVFNEFNFI